MFVCENSKLSCVSYAYLTACMFFGFLRPFYSLASSYGQLWHIDRLGTTALNDHKQQLQAVLALKINCIIENML